MNLLYVYSQFPKKLTLHTKKARELYTIKKEKNSDISRFILYFLPHFF